MNYIIDGKSYEVKLTLRRQKRILIRAESDLIIVSAPLRTPLSVIKEVLDKHQDFLRERLNQSQKSSYVHLFGKSYLAKEELSTRNYVTIVGDLMIIFHTPKKEVSKVLDDFYKEELEKYLNSIYNHYSLDIFKIKKQPTLAIHNLKRAYGLYYKNKNQIVMSLKLAKYEIKYIDLVLCHELTHYYFFDHQAKFHDLLEMAYPNSKKTQREMNKIKYYDAY